MKANKAQPPTNVIFDKPKNGAPSAHQILTQATGNRLQDPSPTLGENTHARIPTEISVKNILMERLHGESSGHGISASPQHEATEWKLEYGENTSPERHLRTLDEREPRQVADWTN